MNTTHPVRLVTSVAVISLALAACGATSDNDNGDTSGTSDTGSGTGHAGSDSAVTSTGEAADEGGNDDDDHDHDDRDHEADDHDDHDESGAAEHHAPVPRLTVTYDGGLLVLDAETLEVEADLELPGFNRINDAGDGRHVLVSTEGGWAPLDAGSWSEPHGDHDHYYTAVPELHDVLVEAEMPAHVVNHDGLTALFDDGTGNITVLESDTWADAIENGAVDATRTLTTDAPHHGVAVADTDGRMLVSVGDEDGRTGAVLLDESDTVVEESDQCPGLHGETVANGDLFIVGCEDGALILHDDHFHKATSPDDFGRIGNAYGFDDSPIVLGDYRSDPDGGPLTQVSLLNTDSEEIQLVELGDGVEYTFRNLARGGEGEALVLGSDGELRVINPETGEIEQSIPVIDPWEVPEDWQEAQPNLIQSGWLAYVTDPANDAIHIVDYSRGEVWKSVEILHTPIEMVATTG